MIIRNAQVAGAIYYQSELTALSLRSFDLHRRTQTIISAAPVRQAVRFTIMLFCERCREGGLRIFVRVCLRVSAVNIVKNQKEL